MSEPSQQKSTLAIGWPVVLAITALALALRAFQLNSPLWYDEIATLVQSVRVPLAEIVTSFPSDNDHPLFSLLAKLSTLVFGESNWSFRLPAALFGAACVPALYWLGCKVAPKHEALAAALLLAVLYHSVWFSQNARGYTIMLFLTLIAVGMLIDAQAGKRIRECMLVYGLCMALAAYTHLTMVLVALSHAVVLIVFYGFSKKPDKKITDLLWPVFGFLFAAVLTVAYYLPMSGDVIGYFIKDEAAVVSAGSAATSATPRVWAALAAAQEISGAYGGLFSVAAIGSVFLAGLLSYLKRSAYFTALFVVAIPMFVVVTMLLERPTRPRFFFFMAGFFILVGVRGVSLVLEILLNRFNRPRLVQPAYWLVVLAVSLGSVATLGILNSTPKQNYELAQETILAIPGDPPVYLISKTSELPFNRYLGNAWQMIDTAADFQAVLGITEDFILVYTFQRYVEFGRAALWQKLVESCPSESVIPSSVQDGEIHILQCKGTAGD